ncbi:hypothetical protein Pla163_22620 [Planctomycetes bacterium Pla163]|uniref:FecR protein n=2 Tax=Rohdeia mirabilis TaxID=2528008 RepID=A0A518D0W8_9BACT|nr:hypothetical protein Pla163_22620 [Planctomycetes bacterium Pla163]
MGRVLHTALAALIALVALTPTVRAQDTFELTLLEGWARATTQAGVSWMTDATPALELTGGVYLELGPDCVLEVVDAGRASFVFQGTTSAEFQRVADGSVRLLVRRFDRLELHTRRGRLAVDLPAGQRLLPRTGVTHLSGQPDGSAHIEHLLGESVELDLGGWYTFELAVGTRRALPQRLDAGPAGRSAADFARVRAARAPRVASPFVASPVAASPVDAAPVAAGAPRTRARSIDSGPRVRLAGGLDDSVRASLYEFTRRAAREYKHYTATR